MKLRLNRSLRRCLLASFALAATLFSANTALGSILYSSVGMQTYTDFGQNCGRYQAGRVNDLLSSIRAAEGGVKIYYDGEKFEGYSYTLQHGMIDFSSGSSASVDAAIGYGFLATVQHNGVQNPSYAAPIVGANHAVKYAGIEYRNGNVGLGGAADEVFLYCPKVDYKITRLSKLVTDVRTSDVYNDMDMLGQALTGQFLYRAGSGTMKMAEVDENGMANAGSAAGLAGAYSYVTGGLVTIDGWAQRETQEGGDFNYSINHTVSSDIYGYITGEQPSGQVNPLPYVSQGGDSGSPSWVWNDKTGTYQYISALQSGGGTYSQDRGAWAWTLEKMESFNKRVDLGEESTLHFSAVNTLGKTITGNANGTELTVQQHLGTITCGGQTTQFAGVQSGVNTWNDLNDIKDNLNWYNYGNEYLNANGNPSLEGTEENQGKISYGELMHTDSIILTAGSSSPYTVQLDDTVDTGIGFVQFSKGEDVGSATFNLVSEAGEQNQLNSAGFVVDKGVTLDISLTGDSNYLREWRKVGDGDLRISGNGDNDILLNVGGGSAGTNDGSNTGHASGRVLLEREGGYAAYNVLASTGSTVVLKDISQVKHDVTLGAGGATLDLNGNDYTWNNASTEDGFTLHMLTEKDILANRGSSAATVTIKDAGDTLLGSFEDSASGAMKVIYAGEKNLAMHSTYTNLKNNAASSFTVQSGSVSLGGTLTVHGTGSLTGTNTNRVVNPNDWHYADAKMNVTVQNGATFTLDSHARLTGDVTVKQGGTFVMREGTKHQMEYIEGGFFAEDTQNSFYSQFHGLKGNITLDNGTLSVQYNQGTDSHNTYAGNITGTASAVTFDLGTEAALSLSGTNDFTVENGAAVQLVSGGVIAENAASAGYVNGAAAHTWNIGKKGYLAVKGMSGSELLSLVSTDSTGVLALTQSQTEAMAVHDGLFIGALEGTRVNYGAEGTSDELASVGGKWLLGGGGGELVVNFALNDKSAALVLGNEYTTGTVTLTNTANHIGSIDFKGLVTLGYTSEDALGDATINLNYGNRVLGSQATLKLLPETARGTLLLDKMAAEDIDLTAHDSLYLGASDDTTYTGTVTPAGETYRFGGSTGVLSLTQALTGDRNLSVDAQHYSGGAIELLTQATLTGDVTVMGYDSEKTTTTGGDITLRLSAENALASAASVTLKDGGILDVNGTHQQLNNLSSDAGSVLADSSLGQSGVAVVHSTENTTVAGAIQVAQLRKTGEAVLSLSGNSEAALYEVQEGTLHINNAAAMAESVEVKAGATLAAGSFETGAAVRLHDGATLAVDNGATLTLKHAPLMDAADTATLKGNLRFNATEDIHLTGTLSSVSESNAALIFSSAGGTTRTREIDHLNIAADSTFTVRQESVDAAVDFRIHQLSGSGTFKLEAGNYATTPGIYTLDGANDFSGTVKLSSIQAHSGRPYNHYLVLENDKALQDAVVELNGWSGNSAHTILAVDTDNARVKGLTSGLNPAQTLVMAGTPEGVSRPTSNRAATLTITGDGTYTFGGEIVGGAEGTKNGLTLVMNGTGTQTLNGSSVVLQNATAQSGTLVLGTTVTVNDTYSIARGATLQMSALNLTEGKTLAVIDAADGSKSSVAKLNGELKLNGGSLSFSGSALSESTAALQFNGLSMPNTNLTIGYTNTSSLQTGIAYKLAGMFSWKSLTITTNEQDLSYLTAAYDTSGNGLSVTFSAKDGYSIWRGTAENHLWTGSRFGPSAALGETDVAVFTDTAASSAVSIGAELNVAEMIVDSARTYTFLATDGGSLTAASLTQQGAGTAMLGGGITVSGAAKVENGTLEMMAGSSVSSAAVSEGASLILHAADNTAGSISGEGALVLDTADGSFDGSHIGSIGSVEVQSGTLDTSAALNTQSLTVGREGTLSTSAGSIVNGADSMALAGTLELAAAGDTAITTAVSADSEGRKGQIHILSGTVSPGANIAAELVSVSGGSLNICADGNLESYGLYFLNHVDTLSVSHGATAQIGRLNYTMAQSRTELNLEVSGTGSTLKLAPAQYATHEVAGTLSLTDGAKVQLLDGGVNITGNTRLGAAASDHVYLTANWGKGGIILDGEVSGHGTAVLQHDGSGNAALLTLSHADNSFDGTYQLNNKTRLIAADDTAAAHAAVEVQSGAKLLLGSDNVSVRNVTGCGEIALADASTTEERFDSGLESATLTLTGTGSDFIGSVADGVSLSVFGGGSHRFSGTSSNFNGSLDVSAGRLELLDRGILRNAAFISVGADGTLALDGMMTLTTPTIQNEGTVSFGSSTCYILGDISTPAEYTLVRGSGSTEGLSLANFLYEGQNLVGYSAGVRLLTTGNAVTLRISEAADRTITWNGTADSSTWDNGISANWLDADSAATEAYRLTDSVVFGASGVRNVTIAGGTSVQNMAVAAGDYSFTNMAGLTVNGTLTVAEGASATFGTLTGALQTIEGSGIINAEQLTGAAGSNYKFSGVRLNIGNGGIDGTGTLSFTDMTLGALDSWTANRTIDLAGAVTIDTAKVGSESGEGATVTLAGLNASGLKHLTKTGAGTLALTGTPSNFRAAVDVQKGTLRFDGSNLTTLPSVTLSNDTALVQDNAAYRTTTNTIGGLTMAGGTATLMMNTNAGGICINRLSVEDGVQNATLQLVNHAAGGKYTLFEIGGNNAETHGNFRGNLVLNSTGTANWSSAALVISDGEETAGARIQFGTPTASQLLLLLGIHDTTVKTAGISSTANFGDQAVIFNGYVTAANTNYSTETTKRTVEINTAAATQDAFYGKVGANLNLVKKGEGAQAFLGSAADFSGSIALEEGTLELNAAKFNGSAAYNLQLGGGTLQLDNAALSLHGGTLNITDNTTISTSGIDVSSLATVSGYNDGADSINGYSTEHRALITAGSAAMTEGAVLTAGTGLQGKNLVLVGNSICIQGAEQGGDYYVNSEVNYGTATNTAYDKATKLVLNKVGAVLNLNSDLNSVVCTGGITTAAANGIVSIGDGVTLKQAQLNATQAVKLSGTGTYSITQVSQPANVTWNTDWTGTVDVHTAGDSNTNIKLQDLGQKGSTVRLNGTQGYLSWETIIKADVELHDVKGENGATVVSAMKLTNGASGKWTAFEGALKGDGTMEKEWSNASGTGALEFRFSGDMSQWTGQFLNSSNKGDSTLGFTGNATEMGAAINTTGKTDTHINVGSAETAHHVDFKNTIQATSLNLLGTSGATLSENAALSKVESRGGTLTIAGGAKLGIGAASVDGDMAEAKLRLSSNDTTKKAAIDGSILFDAGKNTYSIKSAKIDNTHIDLAEAVTLELSDVIIGDTSALTDDTAYVNVDHVTVEATVGVNATATALSKLASEKTLVPTTGEDAPITLTADSSVYAIQLENVSNVQFTGSYLTIALSGVDITTLQAHDWVRIELAGAASFGDTQNVVVTYEGFTATGYYEQGGGHAVLYVESEAVTTPEPATATLSLLALAALAARRKRR